MTNNRVAIVTGGSLGIGFATVAALAAGGFNVATTARDKSRLDAAIAELPLASRDRVLAIRADVSSEADVNASVAEVVERFGRLDILVNSAGVSMTARRRLTETTPAEWHKIIETNVTGTFLMCRAALPHLEKSPDAYVLNVQSTASYRAQASVATYAASKFGVRALTEALIEEYRNSNVRITSVSPGPVNTNTWNLKEEPPPEERRALMMRPSDIADIFLWLIDRPPRLHIPNITVTPWTGI